MDDQLLQYIGCPHCRSALTALGDKLVCLGCRLPGFLRGLLTWLANNLRVFWPMVKVVGTK